MRPRAASTPPAPAATAGQAAVARPRRGWHYVPTATDRVLALTTPPPPEPPCAPPLWHAWFDGAAAPNPGRLGLGVVLQAPDGTQSEFSTRGDGTGCSNEAELQAACLALAHAHAAGARHLVLTGDSDFAVRHGTGADHTAVPRLVSLIGQLQHWMARFTHLEFRWVPRHRNQTADRLSRAALGLAAKPAPHPGKPTAARRRPAR
ncbi:MAG: ribonuclease H [Proteobacteria bacterium]|nr:MAG: ribonuclease H [Pseudomonadota bacterium]